MGSDQTSEVYQGKEKLTGSERVRGLLLGNEKNNPIYQDIFHPDFEVNSSSFEEICQISPEKFKEIIINPELTPEENLNRVRIYEYYRAYQYLQDENQKNEWLSLEFNDRWRIAGEQNAKLHDLHLFTQNILEGYLSENNSPDLLANLRFNREKESHPIGNIKIFRGMYCNAKCIFCFQEQSDNAEVSQFVNSNRKLEYTPDQLTRSLLYARLAYQVREVSYTGGETFVNIPQKFAGDVAIASELGFPQISTMSNGRLLTTENAQQLIDAGLTHLIISIHTVNPVTHFRILNWKDKGLLFQQSALEIKRDSDRQNQFYSEDDIRAAIKKIRGEFDSEVSDETQSEVELTPLENIAKQKIRKNIQNYYDKIINNIRDITSSNKITVRFNLAYNPQQIGTDINGIVDFAENLGVKEITLVEMIPGNDTAINMHTPIPKDEDFSALGFQIPENRNWNAGGIKIYRKPSGTSIAVCNFGQLNNLSYAEEHPTNEAHHEYTDFSGQTKEIVLHPKGNLSPHTYKNIHQENFLYAEKL